MTACRTCLTHLWRAISGAERLLAPRHLASAAAAWLMVAAACVGQQAQPTPKAAQPAQAKQAAPAKNTAPAANQEPVKKEDVSLEAKDHLLMKATYYPGKHGKETVPVILVHGFGGSRQDLGDLAEFLQSDA